MRSGDLNPPSWLLSWKAFGNTGALASSEFKAFCLAPERLLVMQNPLEPGISGSIVKSPLGVVGIATSGFLVEGTCYLVVEDATGLLARIIK